MPPPLPLQNKLSAFSLIEVTIALGIVAFALIPLVGLLPIGLNAAHDAVEKTTLSHIVRQIGSDLDKLSFAEVATFTANPLRFTWEGKPTTVLNEAVYEVAMEPAQPSYPGASNLSNIQTQLQRVILEVRRPSNTKVIYRTALTVANPGS